MLVLDGGRAVRARALFPPDRSPGAEGDPVGGPRAPVDPARRVGSWTSYMAWPLLLPWQGIGCYALVLLLSGGLCTEGAPRGLLAVPGAVALVAAFSYHPFLFLDRALAPAWYRTRDPARADRLSRAVLRASALTRLAMVVPVTAVAAVLIWLAGPGPGRRVALTAGCPALAGLVLLVLLVHRVATGPISPYELERSAPGAAPGPGRARSVVGVVGLVGWGAGMVLFLPLSDGTIDPQLERLRAAGAVVAEVPIETTRLVKRHHTVSKGAETSHQFAATQLLGVRLRGDDGHSDTATVRTMSDGDGRSAENGSPSSTPPATPVRAPTQAGTPGNPSAPGPASGSTTRTTSPGYSPAGRCPDGSSQCSAARGSWSSASAPSTPTATPPGTAGLSGRSPAPTSPSPATPRPWRSARSCSPTTGPPASAASAAACSAPSPCSSATPSASRSATGPAPGPAGSAAEGL
ncbi:hypothetical protein [Streptomyces cacaoi]|uniref:hypothetical protein n=1 Tax=Streptomyces cacaoi TaxID=1898 RepID=UPI00260E6B52|nr:hypothetical protein [Streptomyces cacaoi]